MQVQTVGFGPAVIAMRTATGPTGPWSSSDTLYRPREFDEPEVAIYQGKAHPHLTGADLVLTYSTSSFEFQNIVEDTTLYYPRFVRLFVE